MKDLSLQLDDNPHETIMIDVDFVFGNGKKLNNSSANFSGENYTNIEKVIKKVEGFIYKLINDSAIRGIFVVYIYSVLCKFGFKCIEF